jgi:hypothetical protein
MPVAAGAERRKMARRATSLPRISTKVVCLWTPAECPLTGDVWLVPLSDCGRVTGKPEVILNSW